MTLSCVSLPFRLLGLALVAALVYLGWTNRDEIRRWVHRATAESAPPPAEAVDPTELANRARARMDSLSRASVDSIILTPGEVSALVSAEIGRLAGGVAESVTVTLEDGIVAMRGRVDASQLPRESLGPLADWIKGKQTVEAKGPFSLARVGLVEWRIDGVTVQGVPLPRALWSRFLALVVPGTNGVLTFPVADWVTGIRVTRAGVTLHGKRRGR